MRGLREFTESIGQAVLDGVGRVASRVQERKPLPTDLLESEDAYLVVFDAPGATLEDVQVRYESGAVHVRIDRFREFHDGYDMLFPGRGLSLSGRADLPDGAVVDPKAATATLGTNGTLRVEVPKTDDRDGTSVSVAADEVAASEAATDEGASSETDVPSESPGDDATTQSTAEGPSDANDAGSGTPLDASDHDPDVKEPRTDE